MYFIKTPFWLKKLYGSYTWDMPGSGKKLYLTFDDGPHPVATPFVLDQLRQYQAKGTFFCIGKNVEAYPGIYRQILDEGHAVGNHTQQHLNGWKTPNDVYLADIAHAARQIDSVLFRPPYGRITRFQARMIRQMGLSPGVTAAEPVSIIMWDVLSADFDTGLLPEDCVKNVIGNARPGSIIVFHDSEKAWPRLQYALPRVLKYFSREGFTFEAVKGRGK